MESFQKLGHLPQNWEYTIRMFHTKCDCAQHISKKHLNIASLLSTGSGITLTDKVKIHSVTGKIFTVGMKWCPRQR